MKPGRCAPGCDRHSERGDREDTQTRSQASSLTVGDAHAQVGRKASQARAWTARCAVRMLGSEQPDDEGSQTPMHMCTIRQFEMHTILDTHTLWHGGCGIMVVVSNWGFDRWLERFEFRKFINWVHQRSLTIKAISDACYGTMSCS